LPILSKVRNYYKRNVARLRFRRLLSIQTSVPLISFTFDDFPRSALRTGGEILQRHGLAGTYYTALGLLGSEGPSGALFTAEDLQALVAQGHELGCHTFSHCHSWNTSTAEFKDSILQNQAALAQMLPGKKFASLSYPISEPRPLTKKSAGEHFRCCRAGGQTLNTGAADLNQLAAFFLEQSRDNLQRIKDLIDHNRAVQGWTIFATHDVAAAPGPYGCTPELFEAVVQYSVRSGARILPVIEALEVLEKTAGSSLGS
jgi:peptidoglycan/xylan/chitin deacetylase (PgdA/CDA1 family)